MDRARLADAVCAGQRQRAASGFGDAACAETVSYTHLDVYKRQVPPIVALAMVSASAL